MSIDPFRLTVAVIPLAAYLIVIGFVNIRRRPFLTTGASDLAALGLAISGLVVVGPLELFMPEAAAIEFGAYVWAFLLVFYWLCLALAVLLARPRLVVYNAVEEDLRHALGPVVAELDPDGRWAGDALQLPRLGVQLHLDPSGLMRQVSLVATGRRQRLEGWKLLEHRLREPLADLPTRQNTPALILMVIGVQLAGYAIFRMLSNPQAVAQAMHEMLRS